MKDLKREINNLSPNLAIREKVLRKENQQRSYHENCTKRLIVAKTHEFAHKEKIKYFLETPR
jgi:hypothetical protein